MSEQARKEKSKKPISSKNTKEEEDTKKQEKMTKAKDQQKKNKDKQKEEELSEEDLKLKESLQLLVDRVQDKSPEIQKSALNQLTKEIKESTTSMTSVPKPLKFLRPHYDTLKNFFESMRGGQNKTLLSDILSVLAMTMAKPGTRDSLKYKLLGSKEALGTWGHEYVRHLAGEISQEYAQRTQDEKPIDDLLSLVNEIVPFDMTHNAEHEAVDLLMEVEKLESIISHCDEQNYSRVCLYLSSCANYVPEPEDTQILKVTLEIYRKMKQWPNALRLALRLNDMETAKEIFNSCEEGPLKKQLAFILGRSHAFIEDDESPYFSLFSNSSLSEHFHALGQDLDIMEARTPEDVYKTNLSETRTFTSNVDSARQNLATTFVNAFINAGFGQDKLMTEKDSKWIHRNKEHGMMSATASLGMILLWDVDEGLSVIDKYLYSNEDYVKAGALLSVGILNSGLKHESDPALALLSDSLETSNVTLKVAAILGLGIAYTGSAREDIAEILNPIIEDGSVSMEVQSMAALALGMVFVGTANPEISQNITYALMERDEASLDVTHARFLALGLGLIFLGKQETAQVTIETVKALSHQMGKYAALTIETCAYIGTGNVLMVQKLLGICGDHLEEKNGFQAVAVLGIAMIAMGEEIGADMAIRSFDHLLQYGEPVIRRTVPLALGLLSISNPRITVMDTLSKLSHDHDEEVAMGAIFALGLIGAGTNNSRIANLLRNLATYYYKEPNHLFIVRIAQGLVFMGKGTISLAPYHSDRMLLSRVAMAGLLTVIHSCFDLKNIILSKHHYMLYCLVSAMYPRMLMTFDEDLKHLPVPVRVGQAVDTIGQAGKPKTITGFQTQTTPVLLGYGDRAELATEEYISYTPILENIVILKKNPDYKEEEPKEKKKR